MPKNPQILPRSPCAGAARTLEHRRYASSSVHGIFDRLGRISRTRPVGCRAWPRPAAQSARPSARKLGSVLNRMLRKITDLGSEVTGVRETVAA
jgi:hypothetical protein